MLQNALTLFLFAILIIGCSQQDSAENKSSIEMKSAPVEQTSVEISKPTTTTHSMSAKNSEPESIPILEPSPTEQIPSMVDFGAEKCIPCKAMAPILVELREKYRGKVDVVFVDVWKNPDPGREAKIKVIPTQLFYDNTGKEVFRHEGFYSKDDILAKWIELGFEHYMHGDHE